MKRKIKGNVNNWSSHYEYEISFVRPPSWDNNPLPSSDTQKCKDIIDTHYKSVPANTPVGCNLVVMRPGVEPICLSAGNLPLDAPQHWGSVFMGNTTF